MLQTEFLRNSVRYQHPGAIPGVDTAIPQASSLLRQDLQLTIKKVLSITEDVFHRKTNRLSGVFPIFMHQSRTCQFMD